MIPSKLPEVRAKTMATMRTDAGRELAAEIAKLSSYPPDDGDHSATERVQEMAIGTLERATLYHVSSEMSRLSAMAARTLEEMHTRPLDAPAHAGFMWFDSPIERDRTPHVRAVAWYILRLNEAGTATSVEMAGEDTVWTDEDGFAWSVWWLFFVDTPRDMVGAFGPIMADWEGGVAFGDGRVPEWTAVEWRTLYSAWLLMSQQVADVVDSTPPPTVRRRYARRGYDRAPVKVVTLKPETQHRTTHTKTGREYHHRWIVRAHWRNQWFPKQGRHIPMWIQPHVKGPEGAPILDQRETVYSWK